MFFSGWDDLGLQKYKVSEEAMKNGILHLEYPVFHVQDRRQHHVVILKDTCVFFSLCGIKIICHYQHSCPTQPSPVLHILKCTYCK